MNKDRILCFIINEHNIYLDCILIEFYDIPVLFVCKDTQDYYLCLCYDTYKLDYYVVKSDATKLKKMIQGDIPMARLFLDSDQVWNVHSSDDIINDEVEVIPACEMDKTVLPFDNACYEIIDDSVRKYAKTGIKSDNYFNGMISFTENVSESIESIIISANISCATNNIKHSLTYVLSEKNIEMGTMINRTTSSVSFPVREGMETEAA